MELVEIINRVATGLVEVDTNTKTKTVGNRNTDRATGKLMPGKEFLPGVKTMREPQFVVELVEWWKVKFASDFNPISSVKTQVPYPDHPKGNDCDLVFSTTPNQSIPDWAIEFKHISFCGDNGIKNDHGVQKMLSPYRKDRALVHDIERLKVSPIAKRKAVIGYCFNYSFEQCDEAEKIHPGELTRINNVRATCKENDPVKGILNIKEIVNFADTIFTGLGLVLPVVESDFNNAWRHPCGGSGTIFGWEI